jgi:hypothetical protein
MADTAYTEPLVKSQHVRLLDVFVIGPLMIVGGVMLWKRSRVVAVPLAFFGLTTIGYNLRNYLKVREMEG